MPNYPELIDVFEKAREFIRLEGNDFNWSWWENSAEAEADIDVVIESLRSEKLPVVARVMFLPTGPLQEVSVSSGWGDAFVWLADWYDEGESGVPCVCYNEPIKVEGVYIGNDARFADIFVAQCTGCGRFWLRYRYELEFFSRSGRWFLGPLRKDSVDVVRAETAARLFDDMLWYFAGGSYFDGKVHKASGALLV